MLAKKDFGHELSLFSKHKNMNMKIYLLTLFVLLCVSCKDKTANTAQTEQNVSTIDTTIQQIVEKALFNQLETLNADAGMVIVMNVETGAIRAVAKKNLSENDTVETASLFQAPCMTVALDDGVVLPDDELDTGNGIFEYKGITVRDHNYERGGYGTITAGQIIPFSSNVGMAKIILKGYENNPNKLIDGLHQLGFTDIPKDRPIENYLMLGYGIKIPAIEILQFYNSIASGTVKCNLTSLEAIRNMLINAVNDGTGISVKSDKVSIAGKTGASKDVVSFCGYFPADNPAYSCIVIIDSSKSEVTLSSAMAGSVFKAIAEEINQ